MLDLAGERELVDLVFTEVELLFLFFSLWGELEVFLVPLGLLGGGPSGSASGRSRAGVGGDSERVLFLTEEVGCLSA